MTKRQLASAFPASIGVLGIAFVVRTIVVRWDEFSAILSEAQIPWLMLAAAAALGAVSLLAINWSHLIGRSGHTIPLLAAMRWYLVGQLGKYVPGGVWPVLGPSELAVRGGVARRSAYIATVAAMAATLTAALIVAAITGLASTEDRLRTAGPSAAGIALGIAITSVRPFRSAVLRMVSRLARGPVEVPSAAMGAVQVIRHLPVWVLMSATNVFVAAALDTPLSPGLIIDISFAATLSWAVGFVIIGVPGGIGVREAVFVTLMSGPLGSGLAVSVAVASRLATIVADLLGSLLATVFGHRVLRRHSEQSVARDG